ncbi:MAG: GNAT family N-acetyltransferase [Candidatus Omnitrophota bacterium]
MTFSIRRANEIDLPTIADFNAAMAYETEGLVLDRKRLEGGIGAALNDSRKGWYYLAEAQGEAIAQTLITLEWSDWRNGWWWWIQSVYVIPSWRRKGVFRAIYEQIAKEAKEDGAVGLRLYVEKENTGAQKTYIDLGMKTSHYQFYEAAFE